MQYMLIHAMDDDLELTQERTAQIMSILDEWLQESIGLGVNLHGSRVRPSSDATTVRQRDGETLVIDGPFAETKEQFAGYDVLVCESMAEALQWAAKHPTALLGSIEVRPFYGDPPIETLPQARPGMTRYFMAVCVDESIDLSREEGERMGAATEKWVTSTVATMSRLYGNRLDSVSTAQTVKVRDGHVLVTDGPFAETKEQIAGFDILECADLDEALDIAARHPVARIGSLEVRPLWPFEDD